MKPLLFTALTLAILAAAVPALGQRSEVYPEQVSIQHNEAVKSFSRDFVTMLPGASSSDFLNGDFSINNMAAISIWGDENQATLNQQGYGILGYINIDGDENQARFNQSGTNLNSILTISGDANQFDMVQDGSGLSNGFLLIGSGLQFDVTQTNSGFELNQNGQSSIPFSIQHTGQLPPIIIEKN